MAVIPQPSSAGVKAEVASDASFGPTEKQLPVASRPVRGPQAGSVSAVSLPAPGSLGLCAGPHANMVHTERILSCRRERIDASLSTQKKVRYPFRPNARNGLEDSLGDRKSKSFQTSLAAFDLVVGNAVR